MIPLIYYVSHGHQIRLWYSIHPPYLSLVLHQANPHPDVSAIHSYQCDMIIISPTHRYSRPILIPIQRPKQRQQKLIIPIPIKIRTNNKMPRPIPRMLQLIRRAISIQHLPLPPPDRAAKPLILLRQHTTRGPVERVQRGDVREWIVPDPPGVDAAGAPVVPGAGGFGVRGLAQALGFADGDEVAFPGACGGVVVEVGGAFAGGDEEGVEAVCAVESVCSCQLLGSSELGRRGVANTF